VNEDQLIALCKKQDRLGQKLLYEKFAPMMFGVCKRYVKSREDAEDLLVDGFYKVFANMESFQGLGSFEGWIRRIIVNECLMFLRKRQLLKSDIEIGNLVEISNYQTVEQDLAANDILRLLEHLPTGYRTVFNLYVIEGYKHKEIAELLGISINTSKSQLILAKERMQALLQKSGIKNQNSGG
jgi:RNA polymerase sigma factor (sigma-70 family)